ncbi:pirin family protein [Parvularcula marina]|uniref:pirin family protein n=1 Tax=Parvularcula marina TaxID=2292771 RepID=UPI0035141960
MSRHDDLPPADVDHDGPVETVLIPRARDLGGFEVRRALPAKERQMVGPFIFFDQIGPAGFAPGEAIDVRPHPHIGLATVTYLYEGTLRHRDSLGYTQDIRPGAVNLMTAGIGITHSERSPEEARQTDRRLAGIQTWMALPAGKEDIAPAFEHHASDAQPLIEDGGASLRVILGTAYGEAAPATTYTDTLYVDAQIASGTTLPMPDDHEDRAVYVVEGRVEIGGQTYEEGTCAILGHNRAATLKTNETPARVLIFGGAVADGPRHIWWNFVATSKERIEAAKEEWRRADWGEGRFHLPPEDDQEFIPID